MKKYFECENSNVTRGEFERLVNEVIELRECIEKLVKVNASTSNADAKYESMYRNTIPRSMINE